VLGFNLSVAVVSTATCGVTTIALPIFSRIQSDRPRVRSVYMQALKFQMSVAIPVALGLALVGPEVVRRVYGPRWEGLGSVVAALALYAGIGQLWAINTEVYKAIGRADITPKVYACIAPVLITIFIFAAPYGILFFAIARVAASCLTGTLHITIVRRTLGLPKGFLLRLLRAPLAAGAAMAASIIGLHRALGSVGDTWAGIGVAILVGASVYVIAIAAFDRQFMLSVLADIRTAFRPSLGALSMGPLHD
jgi:O-antigen/teichoic acid export membrane protein